MVVTDVWGLAKMKADCQSATATITLWLLLYKIVKALDTKLEEHCCQVKSILFIQHRIITEVISRRLRPALYETEQV